MPQLSGGWSISRLSQELNMDRRTLVKKLGDTPFALDPVHGGKMFEFSAAMKAVYGADRPADFDEAKTRKMAAEAALAEIALAKERGEVVLLSLVTQEVAAEYSVVRARLLAMPDKLAPLIITCDNVNEARELMRNAVGEALEELSRA